MYKTLMDHARAFWKDRGTDIAKMSKDARQKAYELWVEWAFSNMDGKDDAEQARRMCDIEIWEAELK